MSIKTTILKVVYKGLYLGKKYSPQILLGAGIVTSVGATVTAVVATSKASSVIEKYEHAVEETHEALAIANGNEGIYSVKDQDNDIRGAKIKCGLGFIKLYSPTILLLGTSIFCVLAAYGIVRRRHLALVAAYDVLQTTFKEYRKRVRDEVGAKKERELFVGKKTMITTKTNDEGEVVVEESIDEKALNPYVHMFDPLNPNFNNGYMQNVMFLRAQEKYANHLLTIKGFMTLNDVYRLIGFDETTEGAIIGWEHEFENSTLGVEFKEIDFGIFSPGDDVDLAIKDFVTGVNNTVPITLYPDGVIFDKIDKVNERYNRDLDKYVEKTKKKMQSKGEK